MLYKDKIINDPIFSVQLPDEALQKISELFMVNLFGSLQIFQMIKDSKLNYFFADFSGSRSFSLV